MSDGQFLITGQNEKCTDKVPWADQITAGKSLKPTSDSTLDVCKASTHQGLRSCCSLCSAPVKHGDTAPCKAGAAGTSAPSGCSVMTASPCCLGSVAVLSPGEGNAAMLQDGAVCASSVPGLIGDCGASSFFRSGSSLIFFAEGVAVGSWRPLVLLATWCTGMGVCDVPTGPSPSPATSQPVNTRLDGHRRD